MPRHLKFYDKMELCVKKIRSLVNGLENFTVNYCQGEQECDVEKTFEQALIQHLNGIPTFSKETIKQLIAISIEFNLPGLFNNLRKRFFNTHEVLFNVDASKIYFLEAVVYGSLSMLEFIWEIATEEQHTQMLMGELHDLELTGVMREGFTAFQLALDEDDSLMLEFLLKNANNIQRDQMFIKAFSTQNLPDIEFSAYEVIVRFIDISKHQYTLQQIRLKMFADESIPKEQIWNATQSEDERASLLQYKYYRVFRRAVETGDLPSIKFLWEKAGPALHDDMVNAIASEDAITLFSPLTELLYNKDAADIFPVMKFLWENTNDSQHKRMLQDYANVKIIFLLALNQGDLLFAQQLYEAADQEQRLSMAIVIYFEQPLDFLNLNTLSLYRDLVSYLSAEHRHEFLQLYFGINRLLSEENEIKKEFILNKFLLNNFADDNEQRSKEQQQIMLIVFGMLILNKGLSAVKCLLEITCEEQRYNLLNGVIQKLLESTPNQRGTYLPMLEMLWPHAGEQRRMQIRDLAIGLHTCYHEKIYLLNIEQTKNISKVQHDAHLQVNYLIHKSQNLEAIYVIFSEIKQAQKSILRYDASTKHYSDTEHYKDVIKLLLVISLPIMPNSFTEAVMVAEIWKEAARLNIKRANGDSKHEELAIPEINFIKTRALSAFNRDLDKIKDMEGLVRLFYVLIEEENILRYERKNILYRYGNTDSYRQALFALAERACSDDLVLSDNYRVRGEQVFALIRMEVEVENTKPYFDRQWQLLTEKLRQRRSLDAKAKAMPAYNR